MKPGKLPPDYLRSLLERYVKYGGDVIVGSGIGIDSAVVKLDDRKYLFLKTDPITFVTEEVGWYSVIINSNDIAVCGGKPKWFLATILIPENSREEVVERIFSQISDTCQKLGISWCGGHTEVTPGIDRPIVVGLMAGLGERYVTSAGAREGDAVILTKGIAIEGTIAIAQEKKKEIDDELFSKIMSYRKWLSVMKDAEIALRYGANSMHDPTEGGLATALNELAISSGKRIEVESEKIRILEETRVICEKYGLDPLGLLSSGALLITISPERAGDLVSSFKGAGIWAEIIGVVKEGIGVWIKRKNRFQILEPFTADEILKVM